MRESKIHLKLGLESELIYFIITSQNLKFKLVIGWEREPLLGMMEFPTMQNILWGYHSNMRIC